MPGTLAGGRAAAKKNKERYGADYYARIGAIGGKKVSDKPKGFAYSAAHGLDTHITAGAKGGAISRRGTPLTALERAHILAATKEA